MKPTFKSILALAIGAAAMVFASCSNADGNNPVVPSQQEIETKIVGKWKTVHRDGEDVLTNKRDVFSFSDNTNGSISSSQSFPNHENIWYNKFPYTYSISNNELLITIDSDIIKEIFGRITDINNECFNITMENKSNNSLHTSKVIYNRMTADYSNDIIGMWEGVEMTGPETYGNAEARIEYKADGTYTYYKKQGNYWVPSADADNEYNVDGDWLATRWRPEAGADYNYEWWDIDEIKDGMMKWSALREKEDGTRFTTTFTWKKVEVPTQQEIETKIVGKWKTVGINGEDCLTNNRAVFTYNTDGSFFFSLSTYIEHLSQYKWDNHVYGAYSIAGNIMTQLHPGMGITTFSDIYAITDNHFVRHDFKISNESKEVETNITFIQKKVTADYSKDIIGMWEGVEMTGYETYGNAEARIEYRADGTYTYYKKEGDYWVPSSNVDNEYNVDGDWLAHRWRPEAGADYNYEWWDIDEIKDGIMKWSALREKEDSTRFTTTFTWKRISPNPSEIKSRIVGKWVTLTNSLGAVATNRLRLDSYDADGKQYTSEARMQNGIFYWHHGYESTYQIVQDTLKHTFKYEGSEPSRFLIFALTDNTMNVRFLNDRTANQPTELYQTRITVDYSKDIIGTWESVSVTGDKNYEGVEARITYNADGTYTYRQKSDGEWIDLGNTDTEYFVDGNFLATRWKNKGEDTYTSECWIIKAINDQNMTWSALREKEDGTRFTTTFTWKKVVK